MFGKFTEQVKKSSQPMGSLVALNTKMLESFSQQQTEFFTGFVADSVKYVESLSVQTEVKGVVAAQSAYAEAVKERFAHASKETYGKMNEMRDEYTAVLKTSLNDMPSAQKVSAEQTKTTSSEKPKTAASEKPAAKTAKPKAKTVKPVTKAEVKKTESKAKPAAKKTASNAQSKAHAKKAEAVMSAVTPKKSSTKTVSATTKANQTDTKKSVETAPKKVATAQIKAAPVNTANTPAPQTRVAPTKNTTPAANTAAKK